MILLAIHLKICYYKRMKSKGESGVSRHSTDPPQPSWTRVERHTVPRTASNTYKYTESAWGRQRPSVGMSLPITSHFWFRSCRSRQDRELEDQGRNGAKRAVAPGEETFDVVASDVFHVLASKACVGVVVGEDDVESQKSITHRDALSAGCGSDQLAHRAPVRGGRQGCALHSMVGEVASKVGEDYLGTHDHAEVSAIDGHVSPACALRRFDCLGGRGAASVGVVVFENPAQGSFEGRDGWLVRGEIREQDTGVQQPVGVEDPFDGTLDGDLHGSKAPGHELAFLCADAVFARDGASHAESCINDFVVGLLQSTSTVGIGPVEE